MRSKTILRWSSLAATLLLGVLCVCALGSYHASIHRPGQGGWDLDRLREIGLPLAPLLVLFASLLLSRPSRLPRGVHYAAGAILIVAAPFALLFSGVYAVLVSTALALHFLYLRSLLPLAASSCYALRRAVPSA